MPKTALVAAPLVDTAPALQTALPDGLKQLISDPPKGEWTPPPTISTEERAMAISAGKVLSAAMPKAEVGAWMPLVMALLSHGYQQVLPKALEAEIGKQWCDALDELPLSAIEAAIRQWTRDQSKRPWPADIRRLAIQACGPAWVERERLRRLLREAEVDNLPRWKIRLRREMDDVRWSHNIKPLGFAVNADGVATVIVPSRQVNLIKQNYAIQIEAAIRATHKRDQIKRVRWEARLAA